MLRICSHPLGICGQGACSHKGIIEIECGEDIGALMLAREIQNHVVGLDFDAA